MKAALASIMALISFQLFFVGCEKKSVIEPPETEILVKRLCKVCENDSNYTSFTYSNDRLERYDRVEDNRLIRWVSYQYNSEGLLLTETYHINISNFQTSFRCDYQYTAQGQAEKVNIYQQDEDTDDFTFLNERRYEYDSEGKIIRMELYSDSGERQDRYNYQYDRQGNLFKEERVSKDGSAYVRTVSFDRQINPYYQHQKVLYLPRSFSPNNMIEYDEIRYESDGTQSEKKWTSAYSYDSDGYPIEETICLFEGYQLMHETTITFEYLNGDD